MYTGNLKDYFATFFDTKHRAYILIILCALTFLISYPSLIKPMLTDDDAYARVLIAADNIRHNRLFEPNLTIWLPLHFLILQASLYIYNDIFISPRIITLIFSVFSVFLFYYYSIFIEERLELKYFSVLSTILYIFFPLRIVLSTHTLSEPIFLTLLLVALFYLFRKKPNTILFLFFLNLAHAVRFESWFILPLLWIPLIFNKKYNFTRKIFELVGSCLFPILWVYIDFIERGILFGFLREKYHIAQLIIQPTYSNFSLSYDTWWQNLLTVYPLLYLMLGFVGILYALKKKVSLFLITIILVPIYLFFTLVIQVFLGTMEWYPVRYLFMSVSLFIPFTALGILIVSKKMFTINKYLTGIVFIFFLVIFTRFLMNGYMDAKTAIIVGPLRDKSDQARFFTQVEQLSILRKAINQSKVRYYFEQYSSRLWLDSYLKYFAGLTYFKELGELSSLDKKTINREDIIIVEHPSESNNLRLVNEFNLIKMSGDSPFSIYIRNDK